MKLFLKMFILSLLFVCCIKFSYSAPVSGSQHYDDAVLLTFSNIDSAGWQNQNKSSALKTILANLTTQYCNNSPLDCGLTAQDTGRTIMASNIKYLANYPSDSGRNLEIMLYVESSPQSNTEESKIISHSALLTIINHNKVHLNSLVGVDLLFAESGGRRPDDTGRPITQLNKIMIPLAFLLLFIIALVAYVLSRARKKKRKQEERVLLRRYTKKTNGDFAGRSPNTNSTQADNAVQHTNGCTVTSDTKSTSPEAQGRAMDSHAQISDKAWMRRRPKNVARKSSTTAELDNSDDAVNTESLDSTSELPPITSKKAPRRKTPRSFEQNDGMSTELHDVTTKAEKNKGYEDEEESSNGNVRCRTSDVDSAVELNSSLSSAAQQCRGGSLSPIGQERQDDA